MRLNNNIPKVTREEAIRKQMIGETNYLKRFREMNERRRLSTKLPPIAEALKPPELIKPTILNPSK